MESRGNRPWNDRCLGCLSVQIRGGRSADASLEIGTRSLMRRKSVGTVQRQVRIRLHEQEYESYISAGVTGRELAGVIHI